MSGKRIKVCVVTGSRADYGLLYWLLSDLQADPVFELQIVATGMHLSPEFGSTIDAIRADGFEVSACVETLLSSDTAVGVTKSVGLGLIGFAETFARLRPDVVVLLGDRFEIFAAAQAALFAKLPIAHIGGGDVTEGAFDEAIRHGISKMSHLHFVTNGLAGRRLAAMGEDPAHIFNVGSPGLDYLHRRPLLTREVLEHELDFRFREQNLLVTFHPITLDQVPSQDQFDELLAALDRFDDRMGLIFTMPNADTEGRALIRRVEAFVQDKPNARAYTSLGQARYLGTMAVADAVIGNSSSGLYEAPSLGTPTVNIGRRQDGRLRAGSVFDCQPEREDISRAIASAMKSGRQAVINPYHQGDCARSIIDQLKRVECFPNLLVKRFFYRDVEC
jgi:UDP-hydrolysing UDP-N-acetyl-D-glucosamine 2-epimerase